jgi:hypothetical protein
MISMMGNPFSYLLKLQFDSKIVAVDDDGIVEPYVPEGEIINCSGEFQRVFSLVDRTRGGKCVAILWQNLSEELEEAAMASLTDAKCPQNRYSVR